MTLSLDTAIQRKENVFNFYDYHDHQDDFLNEVISSLSQNPRTLSPKYFYDETGSRLFNDICETSDYYPTRTEKAIIENNINAIAQYIDTGCVLIEPGSGSCEKVETLLNALEPLAYMPLDISGKYLKEVAKQVSLDFPTIEIHAACVDYTSPFSIPDFRKDVRRVAFYPGSSIGNFIPEHASSFLSNLAETLGTGGGLLIGVDLKKEVDILERAYNDSAGVTSAFNKNLLTRINDELDANFDLSLFNHRAHYNEGHGRVEMHLISEAQQTVNIAGESFEFNQGDTIHTESSYKYSIPEFQLMAKEVGFKSVDVWTDESALFSVHYFEVE